MNNVLLLLVFAGLVGLLLVVFYLLDRVNALHNQNEIARLKRPFTDSTMTTMNGRILWDVLSGEAMQELDEEMIGQLRSRYEMVLQKHIELLFEDGMLDGREGFSMPVSPERKVPTLRGEFTSWIPHEFAKGIYNAGHDRATKPETEHPLIAAALDNIGNELFEQVGMPPILLSKLLMPNIEPHVPEPVPELEANADAQVAQPEIPALPAPDAMQNPVMMATGEQAMPVAISSEVAINPVTGAPIANAAVDQNATAPLSETVDATAQADAAPAATATPNPAAATNAPAAVNATATPAAEANAATTQATTSQVDANVAENNKTATPEKVS
jgi:hypothetical protein